MQSCRELDNVWWRRDDLDYHDNDLYFAGIRVLDLVERHGSPCFFYNSSRVSENISRISDALFSAGLDLDVKIYYAMKANRFQPLLTYLKLNNLCGIDACSPNEVEHAMACGFEPEEISFTAGSLSNDDFTRLSKIKGLIVNLDSISAIRTWGKLCPGSEIGIRINPAIGSGRSGNEKLQYSGSITSKFGVYQEQYLDALKVAEEYNLKVVRIHFHNGCGFLNDMLDTVDAIFEASQWFIDNTPDVHTVNIGGGLGVPHTANDDSLNLTEWAKRIHKHFGNKDLTIAIEPGDYIVKDAGILCAEVTYKEVKKDTLFVGLNVGFNIALEPTSYGLPFEPVAARVDDEQYETVTLTGNINEALDIWYRDITMPRVSAGDTVVLINAGAYSSSMASNHCLRGGFKEFILI